MGTWQEEIGRLRRERDEAVRLLREAKQYCPFYFVATGSGTSVIPGDLYMKIDTFLSALATPTPTQEDADEE